MSEGEGKKVNGDRKERDNYCRLLRNDKEFQEGRKEGGMEEGVKGMKKLQRDEGRTKG